MRIPPVYIIGSGNLAWHLSDGLREAGIAVKGIIARNATQGKTLAKKNNCKRYNSIAEIPFGKGLFFCCVSDDAIDDVVKQIPLKEAVVIHCSGMHPINHSTGINDKRSYGVFYPVQSFNKKLKVEWRDIPVCIEAADMVTEKLLTGLAKKFAGKVYKLDSPTRAYVHLAAVFANNFSNAQFAIAQEILLAKNVGFDILRPLILQTSAKVQHALPDTVQTGPAIRNDERTIRAHKKLLKETPEPGKIYSDLTRFIQHHFKKQ